MSSFLGIVERVGLADKVHCCTGAAEKVWHTKKSKKAKPVDAAAASSGIVPDEAAAAAASGIVAKAEEVSDSDSDSSSDSSSSSSICVAAPVGTATSPPASMRVRRVALCRGPGTDNLSLRSLVVGPGLAGRPHVKTWRIEDERVSSLRSDIHTWSSLCTSLWKIFQRGANRNFLARAYRSHKITKSPRILAPTKVRMIVYCGKFLDQSL